MRFNGLDEIDNKILNLLYGDARMTYSDIAEEVGLTRTAVKNRITSLEEKGIIRGYHADINPTDLPESIPFYAYIETKPEEYERVTERLKKEPIVSLLFHTSGNNGIYVICVAESKEAMLKFGWRVRNSYEGIVSFVNKDIWEIVKGTILPG